VVDDALKISASEEEFRALDDGAEVEVTLGFQGGYHVYAALELAVQPANPVKLSLNLCQGKQIVARNRVESAFSRYDETFVSDRHLIYVLHDYRAEQLEDMPSRLAVRVQDADGQTWETAVDVVTRCCQGVQ